VASVGGFWSRMDTRTLADLWMDWHGPRLPDQKDFFKAVLIHRKFDYAVAVALLAFHACSYSHTV